MVISNKSKHEANTPSTQGEYLEKFGFYRLYGVFRFLEIPSLVIVFVVSPIQGLSL